MKIIELRSENVKRVKAIEIIPKDNVVIISGKNDQGKTSVLDSIWFALEGGASLKGTPMPIRKGEKKATVQLVLEDFVVTRNWTDNDKSYLKVTNREGLSYNSPQELLNTFIGKLTFDPLEFAQMKEKDQRDLLLKVADIDIDSYDSKVEDLKEKRRTKGQEVRLLSGEREYVDIPRLPKERISTSALNEKLEKAINHNNKISETERKKEDADKEMMNLEKALKKAKNDLFKYQQELQGKEKINIQILKSEIGKAEESNLQIMAHERNVIADKKQEDAKRAYTDFTGQIENIMKQKETILSTAKMPVEGLQINDTGVMYNEIPLTQLSSSEQLKVSLAIAISLNPELRVIRITDGSLLDSDNMEFIKQLAKEKDYQVWIEKVDGSGTIGFYIEEGEVKTKEV